METFPTIYALIWIPPSVLIDIFTDSILYFKEAHSFTRLFELLVEDQNIKVKFNFEVMVNESLRQSFF